MILDMHVHSTASRGSNVRPSEYAKRIVGLREKGYNIDGFVLTEHNRYFKFNFINDFKRKYNIFVFVGVEVNTNLGHILLYGVSDNSFRRNKYIDSQELIDWANDNNCIAVPAHPFSKNKHTWWKVVLSNIRGVEVIEGLNGSLSQEENTAAMDYARKNNLKVIGGSDAHRIRQFGKCLTKFDCEIATIDDLLDALSYSSYKPIYMREAKWEDVTHLEENT